MRRSLLAVLFVSLLAACGGDFDLLGQEGFFGLTDPETGEDIGDDDSDSDSDSDDDDDDDADSEGGDDGWDRDDCKIEDGDLGRTDLTLEVGGSTVTVSSWDEKDGEAGEYVGFTLDVVGDDVTYTVKAGGDRFDGEGAEWSHPNGTSGPSVSAISHIDFCDNCEDGEPCGPAGGEGEGEGETGGEGEGETTGGEGEGEGECDGEEACGGGSSGEGEGEGETTGGEGEGETTGGEGEGETTGGEGEGEGEVCFDPEAGEIPC